MIKKRDIILAVVLIVIGIIMMICISLLRKTGNRVLVYEDGRLISSYELAEDGEYEIKTSEGSNTLIIEDGIAYVSKADCPDKICVKMKAISKTGENIVCIPHRLVVQISGDGQSEYDAK